MYYLAVSLTWFRTATTLGSWAATRSVAARGDNPTSSSKACCMAGVQPLPASVVWRECVRDSAMLRLCMGVYVGLAGRSLPCCCCSLHVCVHVTI